MVEHHPHHNTLLRAGVEFRGCCCRRDKGKETLPVPVLTGGGKTMKRCGCFPPWYQVHIQAAGDMAPGFPEKGWGAFPGCMSLMAAECLMGMQSLHLGPCAALERPPSP